MTKLVVGLVRTREEAEKAIVRITNCGHQRQDISVVVSDEGNQQHFALESGTQAASAAGIGSAVGGALGAAVAAAAAVGSSFVIPGIGLVVAGPIAAALAGAGAGSATGGLIGALIGAGIPEYRARLYETGLQGGEILIGIPAYDDFDAELLQRILKETGAGDVRSQNAGPHAYDSLM